ncbi:sarcolemma associated protein a isoform X2 [Syngnathus typhle]|uniref:sarcolemma associated protein a isoform X2 n=1 Tax=Syngnathus typhle TaxID=161592 RepID=UPI002A69ED4E|nr:sarcolemma associated protein a isoform X2 [Syngnathus typhle]
MPSPLAVFACRPNSHPFQERHVYLDEPVKIGRSVARCRPTQNNATFDCKVLSRNHALVWFDHKTGKFYLQDTKSSNGTFINSQRLSRGSEESPPCEVLSGDIIQFGVDVTENTRKVTHGCIVSTIKLFLPEGMEARRRSDVIQAPLPLPVDKVAANTPSMYSQELFQLSQYLQEALHREQMLEQKLATLQRVLTTTQEASESSWQALIDEDRLLSRLEVMGTQLQAYSKSQTEDGIRKELLALQEDKHNYETTAKESLRQVLQEKIEVVRKLSEVERSLSNTEDECTHLKEMSQRGQEELRELASKYNAAVNEIKELTDKIKAAEGRQEELTQRGASEKREMELRIEEMEEKEQVLQARIEALQADNDFTNERLAALQVRLEQLQEKSVKENNSLDEEEASPATTAPAEDRPAEDRPAEDRPAEDELNQPESREEDEDEEEDDEDTDTDDGAVGDVDDNCHVNNSGGDTTRIQQLIECPPVKQLKEAVSSSIHKLANFDDAHLQNNQSDGDDMLASPCRLRNASLQHPSLTPNAPCLHACASTGSQMDAKESDMSDTLSPSKDRSSDDTSDGNMDDQELNEPLNRVALLKELHRAGLEPSDTEQVIHHLHRELLEAQELANTGKQKCLELQALLEEERKTNSQQTEESTKQIQYLLTQLEKLQAGMEDLNSAQEEILVLRHAMEAATAERERDSAAQQEDLGSVRRELERWRSTAAKYEEEIGRLQEDFARQQQQGDNASQLQGECATLQQRCASLQLDCDGLKEEKATLTDKLHCLEAELCSTRAQSVVLGGVLESLEKREEVLNGKLGSLKNQHQQDECLLKSQLDQAQDRTHTLQKEYEDTQLLLSDLRQRYEKTEQEKTNIHQELEQCRSNLKLLQDKNSSGGWSPWMPAIAVIVAVTAAIIYPNLSKSSSA